MMKMLMMMMILKVVHYFIIIKNKELFQFNFIVFFFSVTQNAVDSTT